MTSCPNCGGKVLYEGLTDVECASLRSACPNGAGKITVRQGQPPVFVLSIGGKIQHTDGSVYTIVDVRPERSYRRYAVVLAGRRDYVYFPDERADWWPLGS